MSLLTSRHPRKLTKREITQHVEHIMYALRILDRKIRN